MDPTPNVNVIFHGLFLFVEQDKYIDVLIPNMGASHVYRAGAFLAEETLAARPLDQPYGLSGVTIGDDNKAKFDSKQNIVFTNRDFNHAAGPDEVYARISLPYPTEIRSLRPTVDAIVPILDPGELFNVQRPAGVQVLRYISPDISKVSLSPHTAKMVPNTANTFVNLHIICEEDHDIEDQSRAGFYRILSLLRPEIDTPILFGDTFKTDLQASDGDVKAGFSGLELLDPIERNQKLLQPLGAILHDPPDPLPDIFSGITDPPFDCWSCIADNRKD